MPKNKKERNGKLIIVENTYTPQGALLGNRNYTKTTAEIIINVLRGLHKSAEKSCQCAEEDKQSAEGSQRLHNP